MSIVQYELLLYGFITGFSIAVLLDLLRWLLAKCRSHSDDAAVDAFARCMKTKLRAKRDQGYSGWNDPGDCATAHLRRGLRRHLHKGDPVDVANYSMMLWHRGESTAVPEE